MMVSSSAWKPEQPPAPVTRHLKTGAYEVVWNEPQDNGAPITNYSLLYRWVGAPCYFCHRPVVYSPVPFQIDSF